MTHVFKPGDRAFHILTGEVVELCASGRTDIYPLKEKTTVGNTFTDDGRMFSHHKHPVLITLEEAETRGLYRKPLRVECEVIWQRTERDMVVPLTTDTKCCVWHELVGKRGKLIFQESE